MENARKNAEAIDLMIAKKYADRCKKTVKDVIGLMSESRWMPSSEAKDWGFVDKVIPGINKRIQITDEIIGCFNAVGLPVPVLTEDNGAKSSGLVTQILESFKSFLSNKDVSLTNSITMRKEFQFINQLLNCEGVEEKDGKVSLTEENLKVINDGIKKAYNAQKKAEDDLAEVVNELDSLSDSIKDAAGNKAKVQVIRNIVSKIPGTSTISHQENDEDNKFADIATDPINRYENE